MKFHRFITAAAASSLLAGVALVGTASIASADTFGGHDHDGRAVFVMTDQAGSNEVLSYVRASDGSLTSFGQYATGGLGAAAAGAVADPLASQGSLALVDGGHELLAVNAGSDTISVFHVDGAHLVLTQIIATQGSFPVSLTSHDDLVAVLNAGGAGSVLEYRLDDGRLWTIANSWRSLNLTNTTPPFFVNGPGQVGFSPNGHFLVVTTKLSGNGYYVFGVSHRGDLSSTPTITTSANPVPFAFSFDVSGDVVAVEAGSSSLTTYAINADASLSEIGSVSDGQKALCWITSARGYFFGDNAGSANVTSFSLSSTGVPSIASTVAATAHAGTIDSAATPDGRFLYVESGAAGTIDAFHVSDAGVLTSVQTVTGLNVPFEGIAVS